MRYQRLIIAILAIALVAAAGEVVRLRNLIGRAHLAFAVICVLDADTKAPLGDYRVGSPELPGNPGPCFFPREILVRLGKDQSIVACVAAGPVLMRVEKGGYEAGAFRLKPEKYLAGTALFPGPVQTILLQKHR